ncbi:response regulator [Neptuniibacter marinus]|uniref:response regulator n=1 Tax=Neptuniibacter marinus TaxID=1806670 RepID=UPI00082BC1FD|nr:response regulator transcription factor [Neptuniibacter marinus]
MSNPTHSVIVVDDHPLFRRGVVELLNDSEQFNVIAEFDGATDLLEQLDDLYPDILLLDLQMPETSGLDILQLIRKTDDQLKIIILTACSDHDQLFSALKSGANGYLQKDTPPDEIIKHLVNVLNGQTALNEDAVTSLAHQLRETHETEVNQADAIFSEMTERELETLSYIAQGLNNKLIARELGISDGTVKVYVKNLLRKLNLHSRLELAAWAHTNNAKEHFDLDKD